MLSKVQTDRILEVERKTLELQLTPEQLARAEEEARRYEVRHGDRPSPFAG